MDTQITDEQIIKALQETNGLVSLAARKLDCTPQLIHDRVKAMSLLQQTIDASREELVDLAEAVLKSAVMNREPWAVKMVLTTLGRQRGYTDRQDAGASADDMLWQLLVGKVQAPNRDAT